MPYFLSLFYIKRGLIAATPIVLGEVVKLSC